MPLPPNNQAMPQGEPVSGPETASNGSLDPNNAMQGELLRRLRTLSPQEQQALVTGISPPAAAVLKKLLPEIGFIIDRAIKPDGGMPQPGMPGPQAPGPVPSRPQTSLGRM